MISILIVDDDLNKISSIIASVKNNHSGPLEFKQASSVAEGIQLLQHSHFHLLITDLNMPIRVGEDPNPQGGELLIKEIYREKNKVLTPLYIVGLTQFKDTIENFNAVWKVWEYKSGDMNWQHKLRDLIFHIDKIKYKLVREKKSTLFVEGPTDKKLIDIAVKLFFNHNLGKFEIETVSYGGGASWVARQLIIWGKTLFKNGGNYLQAIGLFDNDYAGKEAIKTLREQIKNDSAENTTFSVMSLESKYPIHLLPLFQKGILLPITIEELLPPCCWKYALDVGWLKTRNLSEDLLKDPKQWDKTNHSLMQHINSLNITEEAMLYIKYKANEEKKIEFSNYINNLEPSEKMSAMSCFKPLVDDIIKKMGL